MPPRVASTSEELARDLQKAVSGQTSWSLGTRNARMALATLGYGLNVANANMAEATLQEILKDCGLPLDTELGVIAPKVRNRILKQLDKRMRQNDREIATIGQQDTAITSDLLGSRGMAKTMDRLQKEEIARKFGYVPGLGKDQLLEAGLNTVSQRVTKQGDGYGLPGIGGVDPNYGSVMRPDLGILPDANGVYQVSPPAIEQSFDSTIGSLDAIHHRNRGAGKIRPEYERDVKLVAEGFQAGFNLEKPQGSSIHHLLQFMKESPPTVDSGGMIAMLENHFHSFVVEHDWAAAFRGSEDFEGGEVNLPFAYTCFEFRINGMRVLIPLGDNGKGETIGCLVTGVNRNWYINNSKLTFTPDGRLIDGEWAYQEGGEAKVVNGFLDNLGRQIRAVCIMLDAGVARGEVVEPSEGLAKQRRKQGKSPLKPYHVVRLIKKSRPHHERGDGTGTHKRLHWRRGHWRHYSQPTGKVQYTDENAILRSKTWIHWQLVGDPDLGFVDKHYAL
jgi:hypothetical protein